MTEGHRERVMYTSRQGQGLGEVTNRMVIRHQVILTLKVAIHQLVRAIIHRIRLDHQLRNSMKVSREMQQILRMRHLFSRNRLEIDHGNKSDLYRYR